jgi:hypothetical protein
MADTAHPGSAPDGPEQTGGQPDHAARSDEPPTGGLTAILGKLRDAAAAHDDELTDPGRRPQPG